jgi:hypothetical protein
MHTIKDNNPPSIIKWGLGIAASAGLTGMLCCVAPMVLFMFGIMGGTYAISFADFFYQTDGSAGLGAWFLRGMAVIVGIFGVWKYRNQQDQCSIDPKRQQKNLILLTFMISALGIGFFLSLETLSSWYFNVYIVPAQQKELGLE